MALQKSHREQGRRQKPDAPLTVEKLREFGLEDISEDEATAIVEALNSLALILLKCSGRTIDLDEQ